MLQFSCKYPMSGDMVAIMEDRIKRYKRYGHRVSGRVKGGRFTLTIS